MKSTKLESRQWRAVGTLWNELMELPAGEVDAGLAHAFGRLSEMIGASGAFLTIGARSAHDPRDPLHGYRPIKTINFGTSIETSRRRLDWFRQGRRFLDDPHTRAMASSHGRHRSFLRREIVDERTWKRSEQYNELLRPMAIEDRLVAAYTLGPNLEVFYGFDEERGRRKYRPAERDLLLIALGGMGWFHWRVTRSFGLPSARAPLTPRERETLRLLLTTLSQKLMAASMGITEHSFHQLVVTVYRKLGVRGRAELMAEWLGAR